MKKERQQIAGLMLVAAVALVASPSMAGSLDVAYAHNLSDFTGTIPVSYASIALDRDHDEIYLTHQNVVRIFNDAGMETFSFGDPDSGLLILDVAAGGGEIFALVRDFQARGESPKYLLQQRNYRGELLATLQLRGLPTDRAELTPSKIFYREGRLLVVDKTQMLVVETDLTGAVERLYDIGEILGVASNDTQSVQLYGFNLDADGNMLVTIPTLFRAFVILRDGEVRAFGQGGSVPGTFGVAAGIAADTSGRLYVSDRLRSVVMVFGSDFRFITEFGYRGRRAENLINPSELIVDNSGRIYVTQRRNRGVAVFTVNEVLSLSKSSIDSKLSAGLGTLAGASATGTTTGGRNESL